MTMTDQIEILVEEKSMQIFLTSLLPRILPTNWVLGEQVFIRAHEGKSDLLKSIPKKTRAYGHFPNKVRLIILIDQDSKDCVELKRQVNELIDNSFNGPSLVRIVCHELECWYLGDLSASTLIQRSANNSATQKRFQNPDRLANGKQELKKLLIGAYQPLALAKEMGEKIEISSPKSKSFANFIIGLKKIL